MAVFLKIMTISTDLAISDSISSFVPKYWLNWHILMAICNEFRRQRWNPGGGLDKPTDRDQRSWVFLTYPKKYFATDRMPKKYFPKNKTLKNTLQNAIHLAQVKHDMIIMENRDR